MTRTIKTITVASGATWFVTYRKGDGYSAIVSGNYIGSFDTLTEALEAVTHQQLDNARVAA